MDPLGTTTTAITVIMTSIDFIRNCGKAAEDIEENLKSVRVTSGSLLLLFDCVNLLNRSNIPDIHKRQLEERLVEAQLAFERHAKTVVQWALNFGMTVKDPEILRYTTLECELNQCYIMALF